MKKRTVSIMFAAVFAAVAVIGCLGTETAEASSPGMGYLSGQLQEAGESEAEELVEAGEPAATGETVESQEAAVSEEVVDLVDSDVEVYGPYDVYDLNGQLTVGYEVINNTEEDIYFGFIGGYWDDSGECIGTVSAYLPCLGSVRNKAYVYTVNPTGDSDIYFEGYFYYGESDYEALEDQLQGTVDPKDDGINFAFHNFCSNLMYEPMVTVVYTLNSQKVAVGSAYLSEEGYEGPYLDGGSLGTATIGCPDEFDDYTIYLTGDFDYGDANYDAAPGGPAYNAEP